jgi:hypothetical protein
MCRFLELEVFMARIPQKVEGEKPVKRTIPMAGWVYNAMIDEAKREKRDVNAQIALIIERVAAEIMKEKEKSSGNLLPTALAGMRP